MNFKASRFTRIPAIILLGLMVSSVASLAATKPLSSPQGLAVDAKGNLYVANNGGNQVLVYNANYAQQTAKTISTNVSSPSSVAIDLNGSIWVANLTGGPKSTGSVTEYSSTGVQYVNRTIDIGNPYAITADGVGDIWVESNFNTVTIYPNIGTYPASAIKTVPFSNPVTGVAAHNLWIAFGGNTDIILEEIGPFLTGTNILAYTVPSDAYTLAYDAAGNLYMGSIQNALNVYTASTGVTTQLVALAYFPFGVAVDSVRGRIYVSDANHNQINVYSLAGSLLHTIQNLP